MLRVCFNTRIFLKRYLTKHKFLRSKYKHNLVWCPSFVLALAAVAHGQHVFTEVSASHGIQGQTGLGHAVAWADFDGDGYPDLAISNQDGSGFWLYRNTGGQFEDITASAGLAGMGAYRIVWAELTGNGLTDLVLARSGGPWLFRNNGDLTFTNVTSGSGLGGTVRAAADFNNDGHTDLLATVSGTGLCVYYNQGNGVFTQSVIDSRSFWLAVAFDYNGNGYQDIYAGTYGTAENALLRNNGDGTFTDVTVEAGVAWGQGTAGIAVGDYNNSGWPDIYLGNKALPGCKLFENQGDGTFNDVTEAAGLTGYTDTRTVSFVDYNNDGWLDIFVSNHNFVTYSNQMYRNNGDGTFTDVGVSLGLSGMWMGDYFGVGWADYDLDGDVDLFAAGHIDKYNLFRNDMGETLPANYLVVTLEGTVSNMNAIGATVRADAGPLSLTRFVFGGQGIHDFHDFALHFGLYDQNTVSNLEVAWPSGLVQNFGPIPANQHIHIIEGDTLSTWSDTRIGLQLLDLSVSSNPFVSSVEIVLRSAAGTGAELTVHDLTGRLVRTLYRGSIGGDTHTLHWDGADETGVSLPAGVYLFRLTTPSGSLTKPVTLLR